MAIASDDLFVSSLICLLRLPVNFFCCQVALIPEAAADLNLPAYRKLAEKLATAVGAAVQLAVLTEHCADLALVALEAVESWLDGRLLSGDKTAETVSIYLKEAIYDILKVSFSPAPLCMLLTRY
ncbi:unnamed protein product [Dibothriocephalus latus]|uniref:Uncharacterized protein n=1 Tax=Dibothriocephalus latus TaxID=60516 RepID=A0A3P7LNT0_DIBLA|nr:unnamed protein product [Dibothriocephalus latus]